MTVIVIALKPKDSYYGGACPMMAYRQSVWLIVEHSWFHGGVLDSPS